jgi:hypothetical protein
MDSNSKLGKRKRSKMSIRINARTIETKIVTSNNGNIMKSPMNLEDINDY